MVEFVALLLLMTSAEIKVHFKEGLDLTNEKPDC